MSLEESHIEQDPIIREVQDELREVYEERDNIINYYKEVEDQLIEAKMAWANLDIENDSLAL